MIGEDGGQILAPSEARQKTDAYVAGRIAELQTATLRPIAWRNSNCARLHTFPGSGYRVFRPVDGAVLVFENCRAVDWNGYHCDRAYYLNPMVKQ